MPSSTQCALQSSDTCGGKVATVYLKGSKQEFGLCRQCQTRLSVRMVVDACINGSDIESLFKDIMTLLSREKRADLSSTMEDED